MVLGTCTVLFGVLHVYLIASGHDGDATLNAALAGLTAALLALVTASCVGSR